MHLLPFLLDLLKGMDPLLFGYENVPVLITYPQLRYGPVPIRVWKRSLVNNSEGEICQLGMDLLPYGYTIAPLTPLKPL